MHLNASAIFKIIRYGDEIINNIIFLLRCSVSVTVIENSLEGKYPHSDFTGVAMHG